MTQSTRATAVRIQDSVPVGGSHDYATVRYEGRKHFSVTRSWMDIDHDVDDGCSAVLKCALVSRKSKNRGIDDQQ